MPVEQEVEVQDQTQEELPSGPGSGRSELRQQLEKNFDLDKKRDGGSEKQSQQRQPKRQASRAREEGLVEDSNAGEVEAEQEQETEASSQQPVHSVPVGWTADAKAEWANLPPTVQAAVDKREKDMSRGVEELKAKYNELDRVLQPRVDLIRQYGKKPHEAVAQLFAWFDSLSQDPDRSFPALAQAFKYDLRRLFQQQGQQQQQPQQQNPQERPVPGEEPPAWAHALMQKQQEEIGSLKNAIQQQFGYVQQTFAQQSQAKTDDMLAHWSKDKPHFDKVRQMMGRIIAGMAQDNSIPMTETGSVDLDKVYDMALYAMPDVRGEVLAAQEAAKAAQLKNQQAVKAKAQQAQVDKARRTAVGISSGSHGDNAPSSNKKPQRKTVRESLRDALEEISQ